MRNLFIASVEFVTCSLLCCSPCILLHWDHQASAIPSRNGLHSASAGVLPASHSVARSDDTCRRQHAEAPVCPPARCAPLPIHASEVGACDLLASTVVAGRDAGDAQADLLRWLKQVYEVTAWEAPCLDAVPLLEFAGWTDGAALFPEPFGTHQHRCQLADNVVLLLARRTARPVNIPGGDLIV